MTLQERIAELIELHGSLRAASRAIGCNTGYLSRLARGENTNPTEDFLTLLDMRRVVTYERLTLNRWASATPLTPRTKSG